MGTESNEIIWALRCQGSCEQPKPEKTVFDLFSNIGWLWPLAAPQGRKARLRLEFGGRDLASAVLFRSGTTLILQTPLSQTEFIVLACSRRVGGEEERHSDPEGVLVLERRLSLSEF